MQLTDGEESDSLHILFYGPDTIWTCITFIPNPYLHYRQGTLRNVVWLSVQKKRQTIWKPTNLSNMNDWNSFPNDSSFYLCSSVILSSIQQPTICQKFSQNFCEICQILHKIFQNPTIRLHFICSKGKVITKAYNA